MSMSSEEDFGSASAFAVDIDSLIKKPKAKKKARKK